MGSSYQLGKDLAANIGTHDYMTNNALSGVWGGYKQFLNALYPGRDPDAPK